MYGGKFDKRAAPVVRDTLGKIPRENAMTAITKLSAATKASLETDYRCFVIRCTPRSAEHLCLVVV
jgi:hypothetical protein